MTPLHMTLESAAAQATGWALVHFLWQGTIVALIAASALRLMKGQSANARYLVACIFLLVLVAFPAVTAWRAYEDGPATDVKQTSERGLLRGAAIDPVNSAQSAFIEPLSRPGLEKMQSAVRPHLPWFVGLWFAGVALLSMRLLVGWFAAQRLCRTAFAASNRWQQTLGNLSDRMNLGARVRLFESSRVDVPMVIGWLRPVVLVPVTAMIGLTPVQLETILAHELAHIRRHDYLVNVLQSVVEILFFYHPAVWWLSNRIRLERENCCDDVAVAVCGNPLLYARALTELEELRSSPSSAVAISGGSLRERVTRLVSYPRIRCSYRWVTGVSILSLIAALAVAAPLTLLAQQSNKKSESEKTRTDASVAIVEDPSTTDDIDVYPDDSMDHDVDSDDSTNEAGAYEVTDVDASEENGTGQVDIVRDDVDATISATAIAPLPPSARVPAVPVVVPHINVRVTPVAPVAPPRPGRLPRLAPAIPPAPQTPGTPRLAPMAPVQVSPANPSSKDRKSERENDRWDGQLTVDQLIELRTAGVDAAYINGLRKLGYGSVSVDEFVSLRIQGVTPEYVRQMNGAGFGRLSTEKLVEMRIHGVDPVYIGQLAAAGYPKLTLDDLIELRVHGVTAAFIKTLKDAGLDKLDVDEIIRLRNSGVDVDFIREMSRYKTP